MPILGKLSLRNAASSLIRKHRYFLPAATLAVACALAVSVVGRMHSFLVLGIAGVLMLSSYLWGYSSHAMKGVRWPLLTHLHRRQYAEVWDTLAVSPWRARAAACGRQMESEVRHSAAEPLKNLLELLSIKSHEEVLEIGCGVGRIGRELAPRCRAWTGADMSANMLAYASERLRDLKNVRLVRTTACGLAEFASGSFDVVYSTNMFAHLDEIDRWRYVAEGFRVLRPNGRLFIDNIDLESDAGWAAFAEGAKSSQEMERPPYQPRYSSAAELTTYALRAGFDLVQSHRRPPLVIVTGIKPNSTPNGTRY
jgi:SAM-dependent methyltransferase